MRQQDLGRVVHAPQAAVQHLEHPDFERRAETVLYAAQDAVDIVAVAFELQDNVDDVFQDLGPGDASVLGDVADDEDRRPGRLGILEQRRGAFAYLRHASRRRVQQVGIDGLYRVDHHQVGPVFADLPDDIFEQRLGIDQAFVVADSDPPRAHLDLLGRLLARDIERFQPVRRQCDLQREGRLADARLPAHEDQRPRHHPAAQHTVHLAVAHVYAAVFAFADVAYALGFRRGQRPCGIGRHGTAFTGYDLLRKGVPLAARGAAPQPFGGFEPAILAEKGLFDFCHRCIVGL